MRARSEIGNHPGGTGQSEVIVPAQLMDTVRLYNTIPAKDDDAYAEAVAIAWQSFCAAKEQVHG